MSIRPGIRVKIAKILARWVECAETLSDETMMKFHLDRGLCYVVRHMSGLPSYDVELMVREMRVMFREDGLDEVYPFGIIIGYWLPRRSAHAHNSRVAWCEKIIARYPCTARVNPVY